MKDEAQERNWTPGKLKDLTGQRFGRLTVERRAPKDTIKSQQAAWECRCDCGGASVVLGGNLRNGHTTSCGCFEREQRGASQRTHGMGHSREYKIWRDIVRRCTDPRRREYRSYGKRGITVCERWMKFENFYADMGPCPTPKHSVDRVDNYRGYEPENCRWATPLEQTLNRRNVDDLCDEIATLTADRDRPRRPHPPRGGQAMTDITAALSSADDALNPGYAAAFDDVHRQLATALLALHSRCEVMAKVVEAAERLFDGKFPPEPPGDWACRECRPYSDTLVADFKCNHHALRHAIDTLRAAKGER